MPRSAEGTKRRYDWMSERRRQRKLLDPEYARREHQRMLRGRVPEAHRAQEHLRRAVLSGKLKKPDRCEQCGTVGFIEAAHEDYKKPLEVRWLCRSCHRRWDREPKGGYDPTGQARFDVRKRLTDDEVAQVRALYQGKYGDVTRLGRQFGVHRKTIEGIVHKRRRMPA